MRKAVLDVGSNSVLMVVAEWQEGCWNLLRETSAVTALGEGTRQTGRLSDDGIQRTLKAIFDNFQLAREMGCEDVQAAVTMAGRIASNTDDFLRRAHRQGTPVSVLSGEDEAELGFRAVADDSTFDEFDRLSIVDVGGHSTELVTAERISGGWRTLLRKSFAIGTLGLRGQMNDAESLDGLQLMRAAREIDDVIGLAYLPHRSGRAVALGATGTNLVTIRGAMTDWDPDAVHGQYLDYEEISKAAGWLSGMTDAERAQVPGLEPGRERSIHLGALILERFLFALRTIGCSVSVRGWRHALLQGALGEASALGAEHGMS